MNFLLALFLTISVAACTTTQPAPEPAPESKAAAPVVVQEVVVEEKAAEPPKPAKAENKGLAEYRQGLRFYEEGQYPQASRNLKKALSQGLSRTEQVSAHKHLAFIACVTGDEATCRAEFNKMLALNPRAELTRAEAGHPIWGPIYLEVKASRKKR
ncbi:MAG: TssQ family T6SS-associated lipoprotein [Sulfuricellaceae bacterium]|nr:TssQ family T6SS-associated lipoprotein [Sulfuricellaceae bacterium]